MNRELRFRIWNGSEMVYDVTVGKFGVFYVNPSNNGLDEKDSASLTPFTTKYSDTTPVMQFTGLKDKNGKDIYEGDIFRIEEDTDTVDITIYVVIVWVKEWAMFCTLRVEDEYTAYLSGGVKELDEPMFWSYTLEDTNSRKHFLCGDIYNNPDLLK